MRIHSDTLTTDDIRTAATYAAAAGHGRVYVDSLTEHGSRSRRRAFEVKLIGDGSHSKRRTNPGAGNWDRSELEYAATHDSWGHLFAMLYSIDPNAIAGWAYSGAEDFHAKTGHKYHAPSHAL